MGLFKKNKNKRFGEIAVTKGMASEEDIKKALNVQKEYMEKHKIHKAIGAILTEHSVLSPDDVKNIIQIQKGQIGITAWFTALFGLSR